MPDHETVRRAGEAPVGDERDGVAEPCAYECSSDVEHLSHPGTARRALVPDDDDVTGDDRIRGDRGEALLLGVEHPCRPAM